MQKRFRQNALGSGFGSRAYCRAVKKCKGTTRIRFVCRPLRRASPLAAANPNDNERNVRPVIYMRYWPDPEIILSAEPPGPAAPRPAARPILTLGPLRLPRRSGPWTAPAARALAPLEPNKAAVWPTCVVLALPCVALSALTRKCLRCVRCVNALRFYVNAGMR